MRIQMMSIACHQVQPLVSYQNTPIQVGLNMDTFFRRKDKVVFVIGATGTGKSCLAIDLATRLLPAAEVINSDKMQLYEGLDIATNKVSDEECRGVPHHLLGVLPDPETPFSAADFSRHATASIDSVLARGRLPIVAGGSNSYIEALVDGCGAIGSPPFRLRYECCFLWVDVAAPILHGFVSERVDRMIAAGLVDEVRAIYRPEADYSRGLRRAIGVPELDEYFRAESGGADEATKAEILTAAVQTIKDNTCRLASRQLAKIRRLQEKWRWSDTFRRIDATEAFLNRRRSPEAAEEAWERLVAGPGMSIVNEFLYGEGLVNRTSTAVISPPPAMPIAAAVSR